MSTLIPITWLWITCGIFMVIFLISAALIAKSTGLASQWRDQFLCARELANNRRHTIEVGRARLTRALAAIKEIGVLVKGTELEPKVKQICLEAAKIPQDSETYTYQGKSFYPDELREQALKKITEEDQIKIPLEVPQDAVNRELEVLRAKKKES